MSRQALNQSFLQTSFLHGANAAYIEEMQDQYARNPGSVPDQWRHFFESLQEGAGTAEIEPSNPSWAVPLTQLETNGE